MHMCWIYLSAIHGFSYYLMPCMTNIKKRQFPRGLKERRVGYHSHQFFYQDIPTNIIQFLEYLRTLSLKFQKTRTKIEVVLALPCWLSQFWSEPSEILNLRSSNTPKTVAFTIPWYLEAEYDQSRIFDIRPKPKFSF